ncbi:hypothetical protein L5515_016071 [Caenorhabditis briggsae]|uniref:Uncharacterized protein n=1 Tax=Caenorhabditis briggsae TaxID=6238 RepID=A0AAE8ZNK8_CAEBR|nr:hypothetical protein L3Y34_010181 [Caenorhabditis briggsae]UMM38681.1 hypothetical protein L5515_016071 [Caenorhabditis briggsae]
MLKKNYIGKTEVNTTMSAESFAYDGPVIFDDFDQRLTDFETKMEDNKSYVNSAYVGQMDTSLSTTSNKTAGRPRLTRQNAIVQEALSGTAMTTAGKNKALDKSGIIATSKRETEIKSNKGN